MPDHAFHEDDDHDIYGDTEDDMDDVDPPRFIPLTDLLDIDCPRCGNAGCRQCRDRRDAAEALGFPLSEPPRHRDRDPEDGEADDSYGARLMRGAALMAEGDDSILDD